MCAPRSSAWAFGSPLQPQPIEPLCELRARVADRAFALRKFVRQRNSQNPTVLSSEAVKGACSLLKEFVTDDSQSVSALNSSNKEV